MSPIINHFTGSSGQVSQPRDLPTPKGAICRCSLSPANTVAGVMASASGVVEHIGAGGLFNTKP